MHCAGRQACNLLSLPTLLACAKVSNKAPVAQITLKTGERRIRRNVHCSAPKKAHRKASEEAGQSNGQCQSLASAPLGESQDTAREKQPNKYEQPVHIHMQERPARDHSPIRMYCGSRKIKTLNRRFRQRLASARAPPISPSTHTSQRHSKLENHAVSRAAKQACLSRLM